MDGIDSTLVEFHPQSFSQLASHSRPWPADLQQQLRSIAQPGENEIERLGVLDILVAKRFAQVALELLQQSDIKPEQVTAIGSHSQAIRHRPDVGPPFTLQIGDPNRIAELNGITTIADFRCRDIASAGQGAPLVRAFHQAIFQNLEEARAVVNIGGTANITLLPDNPNTSVSGFDTGPGNTLLDAWASRHLNVAYDESGTWAASGTVHQPLLDEMLKTPYLKLIPPKSTRPELFNLTWLDSIVDTVSKVDPQDIQATISSYTAITISQKIRK